MINTFNIRKSSSKYRNEVILNKSVNNSDFILHKKTLWLIFV